MMSICDAPRTCLPPIDRLEGLHSGGRSLDRRVLVPATVEGARHLAWVYTVENLGISRHRIRPAAGRNSVPQGHGHQRMHSH